MSDYENEDQCWSALEGFRVQLTSAIDPARITPYLRQCKVLTPDDEEQVLSDPSLVIRKRKVGVLLDILQRTGHKGYVAFLESLELYYPQLYRKVTGKEPDRVFSMIIDASGESGLTQLLMGEVMKLQKKAQELTTLLSAREACIRELRLRDSLLSAHQERLQRLRRECEAGARELKRCKDENYELAMRLARLSEEKGAALTRARDLQLEVDGLRHSLLRAEEDCTVERRHTLRLRHAMEQRPSHELLWELQQQKAQLEARVQDLEAAAQVGAPGGRGRAAAEPGRTAALCPAGDAGPEQPLRPGAGGGVAAGAARPPGPGRHHLLPAQGAAPGRGPPRRCAEEKEVLELQCQALRKDARLYKERMEAVLQQMEEVALERDQAIATRGQLHAQHACSLQEKDALRKRLRELRERADELQVQLLQCQGRLLAAEGRLQGQQPDTLALSWDLEDGSPRDSGELQLPGDPEDTPPCDKGGLGVTDTHKEISPSPHDAGLGSEPPALSPPLPQDAGLGSEPPEKERRRLKESFENYRRKRALRKTQDSWRHGEADRDHTTGSDNTDTEGS